MKRYSACCLAILAALVTGCPRNHYLVELIPRADSIERVLTFYREDGTDTNGVPKYQAFPEDQRVAIAKFYPAGVKAEGKKYIARAEFTGAIPKDVGGAGNWANWANTLGKAAMYVERFRGNDDFATTSKKRLDAVDQLTDLLIGWSRMELGDEPKYENLRRFLDVDFRRDFKNFSLYAWVQEISARFDPKADEEFVVRFGQYLSERGYFEINQLPELFAVLTREDQRALMKLIQRLVAGKMGVPKSGQIPPSLAFLADEDSTLASMEKFLITTDAYRARVKQWEEEKKSNPGASEPQPGEMIGEFVVAALNWRMSGTDDHLTVKLSLPAAPIHTNGKWDTARHQVIWESVLDEKDQTPRLPAFCYASWSTANEPFQRGHFGQVILNGEDLLQYCLWRANLNAQQAVEWEALLASVQPGSSVAEKVDAFRFSDERAATIAKEDGKKHPASEFVRELFKSAFAKTPQRGGQ